MRTLPRPSVAFFAASVAVLALASAVSAANGGANLTNGRDIFLTGRDLSGKRITASPPALRPTCAACHRADGSGGLHIAGAVSADLRHKAMVTDQKPPYTIPLVVRAITKGLDNQGHALSPVMPRWRLSARDASDVAAYVLSLK
ncbi:MAG TPA: cytochrome c [Candidatus Elarobacter sp.]|jgi:mono/diheme cytochrome c family protein